MELKEFYGVVSGINFTLLGLWWVAMRERKEFADAAGRRLAYLVSLGFVIPGTIALLSQVAPDRPLLWRASFAVAGLAGTVGMALLSNALQSRLRATTLATVLRFAAVPAYALVVIVALFPRVARAVDLTALQVEAILLCLLIFLGVQAAWVVSMSRGPSPVQELDHPQA
ncbi:hypothetical protein [Allorhizocola rhizosphaerae]|uniref:hypothetical protein n=1 Tax=Allorhizocola rhizosphaerae TaxID=1872709 RepID=UPI000E3E15F9|nr:hypothetical protein [Allorhizocola rhizosphaerae]